jgi:hypothetical protein
MLIKSSDKFGKCVQLCDDRVQLIVDNFTDGVIDQVGGGESWVRFLRGGVVRQCRSVIFIIASNARRERVSRICRDPPQDARNRTRFGT